MSSVRAKNRSPHRLTVLDKILDLYEHTTTKTGGEKFKACPAIANRIDDTTTLIYHYCRSANEDYDVRVKEEAKVRIELQEKAIEKCLWLKTDIRLAKKKTHMREKQVIYWTGMVNDVIAIIKAWQKSEITRYKENHGL